MTIHEEILNFLRDAQYRIGELTTEIDELTNNGEIESPEEKHWQRRQLLMFMEILYEINWGFTDNGYNLILSNADPATYYGDWSEQMILDEIEYLRVYTEMAEMPLMSFTPFWTEVIQIVDNSPSNPGGGINVTGTFRQMLMFDVSGNLISIDVDPYAGMKPGETINNYFAGRP